MLLKNSPIKTIGILLFSPFWRSLGQVWTELENQTFFGTKKLSKKARSFSSKRNIFNLRRNLPFWNKISFAKSIFTSIAKLGWRLFAEFSNSVDCKLLSFSH